MTPEGKVKAAVDKILKRYAPYVHYCKPVQNGMGSPTLDYLGCAGGKFFAIETKAPGKPPTARQEITIAAIQAAGGAVFVINGDPREMNDLIDWIESVI